MLPSERIALLTFVATVAVVYVAACGILLRWGVRRVRKRESPPSGPAARWTRRGVLAMAAGGLGCMAYGFYEPYRLSRTRVRIGTGKLPPGTRPIRIAHLSDLHCDPRARLEPRIPAAVAAMQPDVIVFTGDAVNSPGGRGNFRELMGRLAGIAPTYAVRGNWDPQWSTPELYEGTGVRLLEDEAVKVTAAGAEIWLCGSAPRSADGARTALAAAPETAPRLLLQHYPDVIHEAAEAGADLYLAGHTHGGQIALPIYGALVTLSKYGKQFEAGLYEVDGTHMYVSRGIGLEGGQAPRVRFWSTPEIALIELAPKG